MSLVKSSLFGALLSSMAFAQTIDPNLSQRDAQEQIRKQQQQSSQALQLQSQADVRLDTSQQVLSLPAQEQSCFNIAEILLTDHGREASSDSYFDWALAKTKRDLKLSLPHCLGGEGIGIVMKQLQNYLIERGYVTTRVVAPEQDLSEGKLYLTVILGKIRHTIVEDSSAISRFSRLTAWTGLSFSQGDLLNVRDIEQSLENLKRVPTVEANIEILPASGEAEVGESDLKISYRQALPIRVNLGLDDSGSTSTGKYQASGTLSLDNLLLANDLFYTTFTHSLKSSDDEKGPRASKNLTFSYSIPFGYWTLFASQSNHAYYQEVFGAFDTNYRYSGKSNTTKAGLSYMLYRDSKRKTTLSGSFWSRQSHNYIDREEIEVQKRRMAGWEAGFSHKEFIGNATLELGANFKRGTAARGALSAPEEVFGEGTSRPKIITASLSLTTPFMWGSQAWQFHSSWNAQWNKTVLISQDRFSLGGRYTVRGFDGELSLSGERGWLWRNELGWNMTNGLQFYAALDGGRISKSPSQLGQHLMGSVIGLKGGWKGLSYDIFAGRPVRKPEGFRTSDAVAGFNLGYAF